MKGTEAVSRTFHSVYPLFYLSSFQNPNAKKPLTQVGGFFISPP